MDPYHPIAVHVVYNGDVGESFSVAAVFCVIPVAFPFTDRTSIPNSGIPYLGKPIILFHRRRIHGSKKRNSYSRHI